MNTSPDKASRQTQFSRRFTTTTRVIAWTGCCLSLILAVSISGVVKAGPNRRELIHKRNRFFNPAAVPQGSNVDPCTTQGINVAQLVSLKEVPVPEPCAVIIPAPISNIPGPGTDLNFQPLTTSIVKSQSALVMLGKALFWDMQVGSDGIQSCATCHFSAGADIRSRNQISPNLSDANFKHNAAGPPPSGSGLGGDALFGNSTVPFTANDPNSPNPMEPPDPNLNRPGHPPFCSELQCDRQRFPAQRLVQSDGTDSSRTRRSLFSKR